LYLHDSVLHFPVMDTGEPTPRAVAEGGTPMPRSVGLGSSVFYFGKKIRETRTGAVQCGCGDADSEKLGARHRSLWIL